MLLQAWILKWSETLGQDEKVKHIKCRNLPIERKFKSLLVYNLHWLHTGIQTLYNVI